MEKTLTNIEHNVRGLFYHGFEIVKQLLRWLVNRLWQLGETTINIKARLFCYYIIVVITTLMVSNFSMLVLRSLNKLCFGMSPEPTREYNFVIMVECMMLGAAFSSQIIFAWNLVWKGD